MKNKNEWARTFILVYFIVCICCICVKPIWACFSVFTALWHNIEHLKGKPQRNEGNHICTDFQQHYHCIKMSFKPPEYVNQDSSMWLNCSARPCQKPVDLKITWSSWSHKYKCSSPVNGSNYSTTTLHHHAVYSGVDAQVCSWRFRVAYMLIICNFVINLNFLKFYSWELSFLHLATHIKICPKNGNTESMPDWKDQE